MTINGSSKVPTREGLWVVHAWSLVELDPVLDLEIFEILTECAPSCKNCSECAETCQTWLHQWELSYPSIFLKPGWGLAQEGICKATWKREFKLPWREAAPPNHHDDKVDSDQ